MTLTRIFKIIVGIAVSTFTGWITLLGLSFVQILRTLENFASEGPNYDASRLWMTSDELVRSAHGGTALAISAAISGIVLSEVFRTRSALLYMIAEGAMTIGIAATLAETNIANIGQAATILAMGGFVAGATYWLLAGRSA